MKYLHSSHYGKSITKVRFHPDGDAFVSLSGEDDEICRWSIGSGGILTPVWKIGKGSPPEYRILDAAFHPNGSAFVTVGRERQVEVRSWHDGSVLQTLGSGAHSQYSGYASTCFAVAGDLLIASGIESGQTFLYEFESGRKVGAIWDEVATSFAVHPEGELVAVVKNGLTTSSIHFLAVASGNDVREFDVKLRSQHLFQGVQFSPAGGILAAVGGIPPLVVQAYSFPQFRPLLEYAVNQDVDVYSTSMPLFHRVSIEEGDVYDESPLVERVIFSANETMLYFPDSSGSLLAFDMSSAQEVERWTRHRAIITSLDVDPSGRFLVTADLEGCVTTWKTAEYRATIPDVQNMPYTHDFYTQSSSVPRKGRRISRYREVDLDRLFAKR